MSNRGDSIRMSACAAILKSSLHAGTHGAPTVPTLGVQPLAPFKPMASLLQIPEHLALKEFDSSQWSATTTSYCMLLQYSCIVYYVGVARRVTEYVLMSMLLQCIRSPPV